MKHQGILTIAPLRALRGENPPPQNVGRRRPKAVNAETTVLSAHHRRSAQVHPASWPHGQRTASPGDGIPAYRERLAGSHSAFRLSISHHYPRRDVAWDNAPRPSWRLRSTRTIPKTALRFPSPPHFISLPCRGDHEEREEHDGSQEPFTSTKSPSHFAETSGKIAVTRNRIPSLPFKPRARSGLLEESPLSSTFRISEPCLVPPVFNLHRKGDLECRLINEDSRIRLKIDEC